jgi:hypothetical protein
MTTTRWIIAGVTALSVADGGDVLSLTGTWRIEGDHFCPTWKEFNDGKEVCETWVPDGQNRVKVMLNGEKVGTNYW